MLQNKHNFLKYSEFSMNVSCSFFAQKHIENKASISYTFQSLVLIKYFHLETQKKLD